MTVENNQPDAQRIHDDILQLINQTRELTELADKRIRVTSQTNAHTVPVTAPLPINLAAHDLLNTIHRLSRMLCQAAGLHPTRSMSTITLLQGVARTFACERLAERSDAWHIIRLINQANESSERLLNPMPATILVGSCPWCTAGIWLPDSPASRTLQWQYCEQCGHSIDMTAVRNIQRLRLLTCNYADTASGITTTLHECGYDVKRKTINEWHRRGKLVSVGKMNGRPIYKLGDVLRLL